MSFGHLILEYGSNLIPLYNGLAHNGCAYNLTITETATASR